MTIRNPDEEFVENLKRKIKDANGWCLYCDDRNSKRNKCPKWCGKDASRCMCGMYIDVDDTLESNEYDLD